MERSAILLSRFLLEHLKAEVDLGTPEGGAALVASAKPHLQRVTAPALRLGLVKGVAELADMTPAEVERLCELKPQASVLRSAPRRSPRAPMTPLDERIFRYLVRDTSLAFIPEVEEYRHILPDDSPALELMDAIRSHETPPQAIAIASQFAGTPTEALIQKAMIQALDIDIPSEMVRVELVAALKALSARARDDARAKLAAIEKPDPEVLQRLREAWKSE